MTSKDWRPTAFVETAPGVIGEDEAETGPVERRRAIYDLLRLFMTLDAVALLVTATLIQKTFAQPVLRASVGIAVAAFLVSLVGGAVTYLGLLANHPRAGAAQVWSGDLRFSMASGMATVLGCLIGMTLIAAFFWANWFR